MKYHEYSPHAGLQGVVKCFWVLEAEHAPDGVQEVVPDGCVELIFNFGRPYELLSPDRTLRLPRAFAVGFQDKPLRFRAAAKLLHYTKGQHRIDELADYCRLSVRQLERDFRPAAGVPPKALARALRFEQAVTRIMFDPEADLTRLAHDCGYFDQPHFIKEFKAFAGKTPAVYARQMRELGARLKGEDVVFLQAPPPPAKA